MNKYYSLLGVGLLSAATLISCQEDNLIDNGENKTPQGQAHAYTALAAIRSFETSVTGKEASTRANVQEDGKSFVWNNDDRITIWDATTGTTFSISEDYDETKFPSAAVPFHSDEANLTDGASVWGIYPYKQTPVTADNAFVFELSNETEQNADFKPHLQPTMHMIAQGTVAGTQIQNLNFRHLTALYQFNVTNTRDKQIQVNSVTVESPEAIFSRKLTLTNGGTTPVYTEPVSRLTLNIAADGQDLAVEGALTGYMNIFPTTAMRSETRLTFTVNYTEDGAVKTEVKTGTAGELYAGQPLAETDGYQYVAGKRYIVNITPKLSAAEREYIRHEDGSFTVLSAYGLRNLVIYEMDNIIGEEAVITLDKDGDFDMQGAEWTPIPEFKGVLDGNGKSVSNFSIVSEGNGGFIVVNTGTVKNLTLANVTMTTNSIMTGADDNPNGLLVARNEGTIAGCTIQGGEIRTDFTGNMGALVGHNNGEKALITDCKVIGAVGISISGNNNANPRVGGIAGYNKGGTIEKSSVGNEVTISIGAGQSINAGGIIGWNQNGKVVGCHASATFHITNRPCIVGGLIGVTASDHTKTNPVQIIACYSSGTINLTGGTGIGTIGGLIGRGADEWNKADLAISGCYTTTVINGRPQNIGGFIGTHSFNMAALTTTACFFSNVQTAPVQGQAAVAGITRIENVADIAEHVSEMNAAIQESGLEYVAGSGNEPLVLQSSGPGFGGSDFGDGDEI